MDVISYDQLKKILFDYDKRHGHYKESEFEGLEVWKYIKEIQNLGELSDEERDHWSEVIYQKGNNVYSI